MMARLPNAPTQERERGKLASSRFALTMLVFLLLAGACGGDSEDAYEMSAAARSDGAAAPPTTMAPAAEATVVAAAEAMEDAEENLEEVQAALVAADDAAIAEQSAAVMMAEEDVAMDEEVDLEDVAEGMAESDAGATVDQNNAGALVEVSTIGSQSAFGRDIIYQAWVSVEATDVGAATHRAIAIVQGLGGFVFGQQTRTRPAPYSEIVFKVAPEDFSTALARLSEVGELIDQQISADDVTERIVDLQSQTITAEASVGRLRSFLETATNLENVAFYERELLIRETDLERLRGQLRTLQDRVALATITLAIRQLPERPLILPNTGLLVTAWVSTDGEDPCLGTKNLTVERDDTVDFCVEVANQGEVTLTDVEFSSDILPLDENPFVVERGSLNRIEPGQFLTATLTEEVTKGRLADRIATRGLDILIEATATPMDPNVPQLGVISDRSRVVVTAEEIIPNTGVIVHAWVSGNDDDPCLGSKSITVKPDDDVVKFCFFVANPGEVPITNIEVESPALDFDSNPLVLEHGDFSRIEPRQFLTATLTETVEKGRLNGRVATRGLDIGITSIATPVDTDGSELETVSDSTGVSVTAQEVLPNTSMIVSAWVSANNSDPCLGEQSIAISPDEDTVNFCLEIGNLGDTALTNIQIRSNSLRLDQNPFAPEHGDFDRIEPGQFLTATLSEPIENGRLAGRIATRGIDAVIEATATPVDTEGAALEDVSTNTRVFVDVLTVPPDDDSPTGFSDALGASFETLVSITKGLAVVIGALLPFLPVIAILVAIWWWIRRRPRHSSAPPAPAEPESSPTD